MSGIAPTPTIDRVFQRLRWDGDCLVYDGASTAYGYGVTRERVDGKRTQTGTHVVVYRETVGPIPDGNFVCHTCDNPPCCNPEHLWVGPPKANSEDMASKGRGRNHLTGVTKCRKGHDFTEENTYTAPAGWRMCRICHRNHEREYRERKKASSVE